MNTDNKQMIENDEISLKDLILLIQKYFGVLLKSWWIIGLCAILFAGLFFYRASTAKIAYKANLSYTSSEGGGLAGLAGGLVGSFLGRGKSNPLIKAQAMASTRKIARMALFQKAYVDGKLDYLINHHGRIYKTKDFQPFKNEELKTDEERKIFQKIVKAVNKSLMSQSLDEESGIAGLTIKSPSEEYSIELVRHYFESLVEFYKETEVGEQEKTLYALEYRADSIYNAIQGNVYKVARIKDSDKGIFWATDKVPEAQATAELQFLTSAYEEIVKNLETLKFTVASNTPAIQVIDYPISPIKPESRGRLKAIIIGGFLGGFLSSLVILGRTIFREIMTEDDKPEPSMV